MELLKTTLAQLPGRRLRPLDRALPGQAPADSAARLPSLRSNFAWTFTGNAIYGACQWGVMSLIAKLGSGEMLGQYALALALVMPVAMLSHLNLRSVLATDMAHRHPFGDYEAVRLRVSLAATVVICLMALSGGYASTVSVAMILIGLSLSLDIVSDVYYGALMRNERMAEIALSLVARGGLSVAGFGIVLALTRSLIPAIGTLVVARLAVLLLFDRPRAIAGQDLSSRGRASRWEIFRTALPLGIVLMLVSLTSSVPRYAIESFLGTKELGAFAAVAAFLTAGSSLVNALGQSATPRLARHFCSRESREFRRLSLRLIWIALAIGVFGIVAALVAGRPVLALLYRSEYAEYCPLLVEVMGAASLIYVASVLGYVVTSARSFIAQMPVLAVVAGVSFITSWIFVPLLGLRGAALAVALTASVQILGQLLILRRVLVRLSWPE